MSILDLNLMAGLPEIVLLVLSCAILLIDPFVADRERRLVHRLSLASVLIVGLIAAWQLATGVNETAFLEFHVADPLAHFLKIVACVATFITLIYARSYAAARGMLNGELYALVLFSLLGMFIMISAGNLLMVYLGLELMSLSLYALVALRRDHAVSTEASMKYFVLGALASGFMLYGMSMLYGATGTLDLTLMGQAVTEVDETSRMILVFGMVFLVAGLAFKLGAVPFHMWVPDVYQGAPTAVTLMIAAAPKLATFAIAYRLLVDGLLPLAADWQPMLAVLAVASLVIGNLAAIAQTNFKRMLAYSTIAHMGFLMLGLMSGVSDGSLSGAASAYGASLFYIVLYVLMTLGSLGLVLLMSRQGHEAEEISDLKGLARRSPWFAFVLLLLMFSLAGIPPLAGFHAKLAVLQVLVDAGHVGLAVFAVLASLVGAFYYLRIVKVAYFDEPDSPEKAGEIAGDGALRSWLSVNGAMVLGLGLVPGPLLAVCVSVVAHSITLI